MTDDELLAAFGSLNIWAKADRRAPHKPLLILLALGRWAGGDRAPLPFADVEKPLRELLAEVGPPRASSPEEPFWRLRRDGVWELGGTEKLPAPAAPDPPGLVALRAGVTGQFTADVRTALERSPGLIGELARSILFAHFPESLHADILAAVGLDISVTMAGPLAEAARRTRDPRFRGRVLTAYGYRCAVCGFAMRLGLAPVALEAAHGKWVQAGGPDDVSNGLALCAIHHKAFDLGAFMVEPGGRVVVSADVNGEGAEVLLRHHREKLTDPAVDADRPGTDFLGWHRAEVFRGRARS